MQKILLTLTMAMLVAGLTTTTEAASRVSRLIKLGEEASNFFWRNKVAITTGTILVTAASCPEVFVEGAVALASGPPVIVQNYESVVQKRTGQIPWRVFGGLIGVLVLGILYATGGRSRTAAKIVTVILLLAVVLYFNGVAHAGTGIVEAVAARSIWSYLLDLILILLMLNRLIRTGLSRSRTRTIGILSDPSVVVTERVGQAYRPASVVGSVTGISPPLETVTIGSLCPLRPTNTQLRIRQYVKPTTESEDEGCLKVAYFRNGKNVPRKCTKMILCQEMFEHMGWDQNATYRIPADFRRFDKRDCLVYHRKFRLD